MKFNKNDVFKEFKNILIFYGRYKKGSKYFFTGRIIRRNAYHEVSKYDKGRIDARQRYGLSLWDNDLRTRLNQNPVMRICNKWSY